MNDNATPPKRLDDPSVTQSQSAKPSKPQGRTPKNTALLVRIVMWTLFGLLLLQIGFGLVQSRNA
jgi:hypothetical protein